MPKLDNFTLELGGAVNIVNDIYIYQPTIQDFLDKHMEEMQIFRSLQILSMSPKDYNIPEEELGKITSYQLLLGFFIHPTVSLKEKSGVIKFLEIIFHADSIEITELGILIKLNDSKLFSINEDNFNEIQNTIREIFCTKDLINIGGDYNPKGQKAQEIAEKLRKRHEILSKQTEKETQGKSLLANYIHVLSIGTKIPLRELKALTIAELMLLMKRFGLYEEWQIDLKCRLAGGDPKKSPENWMKII